MSKVGRGLAVAVLTVLGTLGVTKTSLASDRTLPVQLRNYAGIPSELLQTAEAEVSVIFENAGIRIQWLDSNAPLTDRGFIIVNLLSRAPAQVTLHGEALGFTQITGTIGHFTNVIDSRVDDLMYVYPVSKATLLAVTISHEMGHLLLVNAPHSASGIMHASWTQKDLRLAEQGMLAFSVSQVQMLQAAVDARCSATNDEGNR